jgi:hypothetical protein
MKAHRMLLAMLALGVLTGVAYVRQAAEPAGAKMAVAAEKFLAGLTPEQRAKTALAFDGPERMTWTIVPLQDKQRQPTRKGVKIQDMTPEQRATALNLLRSGTSAAGYAKATAIMSLEAILRDLEKGGGMVRDPEWYFFTVFGTPSNTGKWGWRVEGHHLSLNFTLDGGKVVGATPACFGSNPAVVKSGPRQGEKTLTECDDLARDLVKSLDDEQKKVAVREKQFPEVGFGTKGPKVGEPEGLPASRMTQEQRETLVRLLKAYTDRMPADIAEVEWNELKQAGLEKVHFAYAGGTEPGQPHSYRLQGPTFVVEFQNVQSDSAKNPANHIHSAWRKPQGDFGAAK